MTTTTKPRTVRFWIFENLGYVRLTLRPGQTLAWASGGATDEGWSSRCVRWKHDGDTVSCEVTEDGRDCDGRSSWGADLVCPVENLRAWHPSLDYAPAEGCPDWQEAATFQRDYAAEAAGY